MSLHVRRLGVTLTRSFSSHINLSDYDGRAEPERNSALLTRSLAAYALTMAADVDPRVAAAAIVDGFDDNGLDAIQVNKDEKRVYVVQSKWDNSGSGGLQLGDVQKFLQGFRDLVEARFDRFNAKVRAMQAEILDALDDPLVRFVLVLAHSGSQPLSSHARRSVDDLLNEFNEMQDTVSLRHMGLKDFVEHVTAEAQGRSIRLEVMLHEWAQVKQPYSAYYGRVDATDVASWLLAHGQDLFARNLRKFLQSTEVNEAIIGTLKTCPQKFWYFNNGITVLSQNLHRKPIGGTKRASGVFVCEGATIVNGAQTVGCIGEAFARHPDQVNQARVGIRLISLGNCPEGFETEVTRATNTQNRIERRDFASLDPEQERLRKELLLDLNKFYVYKTGDPPPSPAEGCTIDDATVALACAHDDLALAVQAKREVGKLWEDVQKEPYTALFRPGLTALRLWRSVEILRAVDAVLKEQQAVREGRERMVAVHGNRLILHQVFRLLPRDRFDDDRLDFEGVRGAASRETVVVLELLAGSINQIYPNAYLNSLFKNLSKCKALTDETSIRFTPEGDER
jgi:AIPR protein